MRCVVAALFVVIIELGLWYLLGDPTGVMNEGRRRETPNWLFGLMITPCAMTGQWCFFQQLRFERRS